MIIDLKSSLQILAREAGEAARAAIRQGAIVLVAGLIGAMGAGFLLHAGFTLLQAALGPVPAELATGVVLLVLATVLAWVSRRSRQMPRSSKRPVQPTVAPVSTQPRMGDVAAMAAFTAAYVLGRRLASRSRT